MPVSSQKLFLKFGRVWLIEVECWAANFLKFVGSKAKGRISKRVLQENKACYLGGKKCLFLEKSEVLCFYVTQVLRFALIADKLNSVKFFFFFQEKRFVN